MRSVKCQTGQKQHNCCRYSHKGKLQSHADCESMINMLINVTFLSSISCLNVGFFPFYADHKNTNDFMNNIQ